MSWTDVFPVLTDEMVEVFCDERETEIKKQCEEWMSVETVVNRKKQGKHLVATSLFWKRDSELEDDLPPITRNTLVNSVQLGILGRYPPWESYVVPLIENTRLLSKIRPDVVIRVYLANDLEFLVDELVESGCEVHLMKTSSIRHNPGAMWRFLALEEASVECPVTVTDSDRIKWIPSDLARMEAAREVGVAGWRTPYNFAGSHAESYRPFTAAQFGSNEPYPMRSLTAAFIWHNICGTMPLRCRFEGLRENEIAGTAWPDYGFDEWFLLAVMFPRMVHGGLLTFVPWDIPALGQLFTLDIEYCTWANPASELINYPTPEDALGDIIRPWSTWSDDAKLWVRPRTVPVCRTRKKMGPAHKIHNYVQRDWLNDFPRYKGDLPSFLTGATAKVTETSFIDLNPLLLLASEGGELFLDRRYEDVDVVFCGYYFVKITSAIAEWARNSELDEQVWGERKILKVPKLEGPMTLWKAEFSRQFHEELVAQAPFVKAEILLRAWMDQGKVRIAETTAKQMGWAVR